MIPYLVTAMLVAGLGVARVLLVAGLGVAHGLEPDHLAAMRTMRTRRKYLKFSVGHGLGFALISIPIVLLFGLVRELEWAGDIIGLAMGVVLLYEELSGREFQLSGGPIGVAQGALALTPSKVLLAVLAAEAGLLLGGVYVGPVRSNFIIGHVLFCLSNGVCPTQGFEGVERGDRPSPRCIHFAYIFGTNPRRLASPLIRLGRPP